MGTTYEIHSFVRDEAGQLVRRSIRTVASASEAKGTSAAMMPTVAGIMAFEIVKDEAGKLWTLNGLGSFGDVPAGYAERLFGE